MTVADAPPLARVQARSRRLPTLGRLIPEKLDHAVRIELEQAEATPPETGCPGVGASLTTITLPSSEAAEETQKFIKKLATTRRGIDSPNTSLNRPPEKNVSSLTEVLMRQSRRFSACGPIPIIFQNGWARWLPVRVFKA
jgi:hypothetical protein